jgi:hypothetical protein
MSYLVVEVTTATPRTVAWFATRPPAEAWQRSLAAGRPDLKFMVYLTNEPRPGLR